MTGLGYGGSEKNSMLMSLNLILIEICVEIITYGSWLCLDAKAPTRSKKIAHFFILSVTY